MFALLGSTWAISGISITIIIAMAVIITIMFRTVVETDEVHIVQTKKKTIDYGSGLPAGNVYMSWPYWVPVIGIQRKIMPTTIFGIDLNNYAAFDEGKVPFRVDVKAFFQVKEAGVAAKRVRNMKELEAQLRDILSGSVRTILANAEILTIMESRGEFGERFTKEVKEQLTAWGVETVKNIEFMDIKDDNDSKVIENIMAKKKSIIEKESREVVATNMKLANIAEIEAQQEVDLQEQEAEQKVGERTAEKDKLVGIANEKAQQDIKEQARVTAEKEMAVRKVEEERQAVIDKNVAEIKAEQDKIVKQRNAEADLIEKEKKAEGDLIIQIKGAEGHLAEESKKAEGIQLVGTAEAEALKAKEMAPVTAQIELAREIGENQGYQNYLLGVEGLKAGVEVGVAKADAMAAGDLKIIANAGDVEGGVNKMMDVFSSKGGTAIGSMLESLSQTDMGKQILEKFTNAKEETK